MKMQIRLASILCAIALFVVAGCGAPAATNSNQASPPSAGQAVPKAVPTAPASAGNPVAQATAAPKASAPANKPNAPANCAALDTAYGDFALNSQILINLRDDAIYTALRDNTSPVRLLDTGELRADLDVLSLLPDPGKAGADKPSDMVRQFRQVLDLVDGNIKSGKPFSDGSGNGQKVMDLVLPLMMTQQANVAFSSAYGVVCASYTPAPRPTDTPQAFKSKTKAECATLDKAVEHFMPMAQIVLALTDDDTYAVVGKPDAEFYIDTTGLRSDLAVFATLPDIAEVTAIYDGTLSQLLPQFGQSLDQIDANVKAGSTPFSDGNGNGQKVIDLARPLLAHINVLLATSSDVCK